MTLLRDKICNTGEVKADVSATDNSHLVQGISQRVGPASTKQGSISTTAWQQSFTGQHVWHEERAASPSLQPKEAASTKYPGEDRKPIPKNLNWGSQLKFRPAEHGFDRDFKLHHLRTDKWTKPFGLKSPQQFQH